MWFRDAPSLIRFLQLRVNSSTLETETQLIDKMAALDRISNKKRKVDTSSEEQKSTYDDELKELDLSTSNLHI